MIGSPPSGSCLSTLHSDASLQNPSEYPLIWCGSHWTRSLNAHSGVSDTAFFNGQQLGGTNIAYADGHVRWEAMDVNKWFRIYGTAR